MLVISEIPLLDRLEGCHCHHNVVDIAIAIAIAIAIIMWLRVNYNNIVSDFLIWRVGSLTWQLLSQTPIVGRGNLRKQQWQQWKQWKQQWQQWKQWKNQWQTI